MLNASGFDDDGEDDVDDVDDMCACGRRRCRCVLFPRSHVSTWLPPHRPAAAVQFTGHSDSVYSVAVSPDAALAASGGGDDVACVWDVGTGELRARLEGHKDTIISLAFNHDGTLLATGCLDSTVKVWVVPAGTLVSTLEGPGEDIEWVAWHPRGNVVAAGSADYVRVCVCACACACVRVRVWEEGCARVCVRASIVLGT